MNIYEECPTLESERFILRLFEDSDRDDLYRTGSAVPFGASIICVLKTITRRVMIILR
jgi:hypothetical protein